MRPLPIRDAAFLNHRDDRRRRSAAAAAAAAVADASRNACGVRAAAICRWRRDESPNLLTRSTAKGDRIFFWLATRIGASNGAAKSKLLVSIARARAFLLAGGHVSAQHSRYLRRRRRDKPPTCAHNARALLINFALIGGLLRRRRLMSKKRCSGGVGSGGQRRRLRVI